MMAAGKAFCFYIAPIGEERTATRKRSDMALEYIVRPALQAHYDIKRADEDDTPRQIGPQLIRDINEAELIVCDLTGLNPNVMFELGVALTLAKPVIQIADIETVLPFDLSQSWTIFFDALDPTSHKKARAAMSSAAEGLRRARRVSNIVTDSLERFTYEDFRTGTSNYDEQFERLKGRLGALERRGATGARPDPVGAAFDRAERGPPADRGRAQAEAAGQLIDFLAGQRGFERVAVDRIHARRLIVYGDPSLDTSELDQLVDGFELEFRLRKKDPAAGKRLLHRRSSGVADPDPQPAEPEAPICY